MEYSGARFRRRFVGYDRSAVDVEFERLLSQVDEEVSRNEELRREISDLKEERKDWEYAKRALEEERTAISRDRASLAESVSSISSKVAELETSLSSAKVANEALQQRVEATTSERNQLQLRLDTVQERNRELTLRERQFDEIEKSVSSIMSVTKRATDRLFQKSVENQENVIRIAGDAAQEAAMIRADLSAARDDMNVAFDELQDRIDKIDASLTGAVHKLVAIKHDSGLKARNADATIESEVERLLSLRAGEIDYSDGKGYAVPVLGPYSAKFISDTAKKVNSGELEGNPPSQQARKTEPAHSRPESAGQQPDGKPTVRKTYPSNFDSTDASIREANKLLDAADDAAEQRNYVPLQQQMPVAQPVAPAYSAVYNPYMAQPYTPPVPYYQPPRQNPIGFGYHEEPEEPAQSAAPPTAPPEQINPYAEGDYERVDISKLGSDTPTINMGSPEIQYIQPQQVPQYAFDGSPVQMSMNISQPIVSTTVPVTPEFATAAPTFTPNVPVVSANAQPQIPVSAPVETPADEPVSAAKRVEVTRKVRQVPVDNKVPVTVRHGNKQ